MVEEGRQALLETRMLGYLRVLQEDSVTVTHLSVTDYTVRYWCTRRLEL